MSLLGDFFVSRPLFLHLAPVVVISSSSNLCHQVTTNVSAVILGGTPPFSFLWDGSASTDSTLFNQPFGNYSVRVLDGLNCTTVTSRLITPPIFEIALTQTVSRIACDVDPVGNVSTFLQGGTPPFVFNWNNGAQSPNLTNVAPGLYEVNVTEAFGCKAQSSILFFGKLQLVLVPVTPCANASLFAGVTGGTPPYHYLWSFANTTLSTNSPIVPDVTAGAVYSALVTDAGTCSVTSQLVYPVCNETSVLRTSTFLDSQCSHLFTQNGFSNASCIPDGGIDQCVPNGALFSRTECLTQLVVPVLDPNYGMFVAYAEQGCSGAQTAYSIIAKGVCDSNQRARFDCGPVGSGTYVQRIYADSACSGTPLTEQVYPTSCANVQNATISTASFNSSRIFGCD